MPASMAGDEEYLGVRNVSGYIDQSGNFVSNDATVGVAILAAGFPGHQLLCLRPLHYYPEAVQQCPRGALVQNVCQLVIHVSRDELALGGGEFVL